MPATGRAARAVNAQLARRFGVRFTRVGAESAGPRVPVRAPADPSDRLLRRPVFVLSPMRSGSTLLRLILNSHSQIHAPHETHFRKLAVELRNERVRQAMKALDLNQHDLEHLLWDRLLHRQLTRSGKSVLVEKTPGNVFIVDRLALAWPDARFVFLLRHPYSIAQSWHDSAPDRRTMAESIALTQRYVTALEKARKRHSGLTLRYEDLTEQPEREIRRVCAFLDVPWEPGMLDYGAFEHGRLARGLGDWRGKIKSGTIQPPRALPAAEEIPDELAPACRAWNYG